LSTVVELYNSLVANTKSVREIFQIYEDGAKEKFIDESFENECVHFQSVLKLANQPFQDPMRYE